MICTNTIMPIPIVTNTTGTYLSYIRLSGVKNTTSAVIPNILNSIPVAADVKSISATFSGNANAIVPLLIISAKAASEACSTAGFFSSGQKCLNDALQLSIDLDDLLI